VTPLRPRLTTLPNLAWAAADRVRGVQVPGAPGAYFSRRSRRCSALRVGNAQTGTVTARWCQRDLYRARPAA
jgi:hypothetical protein